ncbi:PREDICTED: uncharacterized protein LOC104585681 isoform X5 [Nelumbo nucifera]|uniref:Uncharacterized protein LOC104585681 isoform X5 n=1 Tax=Nelumbo nucifera TaxID=4432 RepID=A0A1U8QBC1_NELNU|nr:PREDICTED: uncharacterized protein LOC104585681 isoform X5 [Nelumbo nucifera]
MGILRMGNGHSRPLPRECDSRSRYEYLFLFFWTRMPSSFSPNRENSIAIFHWESRTESRELSPSSIAEQRAEPTSGEICSYSFLGSIYFTATINGFSHQAIGQKLASSCAHARSKHLSIYTGYWRLGYSYNASSCVTDYTIRFLRVHSF